MSTDSLSSLLKNIIESKKKNKEKILNKLDTIIKKTGPEKKQAYHNFIIDLISRDYKMTKKNNNKSTILMLLAELNYHETLDYLLTFDKIKEIIDAKNEFDETALHFACYFAASIKSIDVLIKHGANPNIQEINDYYTPIAIASSSNNIDIIIKLLQYEKTDIYIESDDFNTIFLSITARNQIRAFYELKKHKDFNVNITNSEDMTMLMAASENGNLQFVKELLKCPGIDVNAHDETESTALFHAVSNNRKEIVKELLQHGANQFYTDDGYDYSDFTIRCAIDNNSYEIIDILVDDYINKLSFLGLPKDIVKHIIIMYLYGVEKI